MWHVAFFIDDRLVCIGWEKRRRIRIFLIMTYLYGINDSPTLYNYGALNLNFFCGMMVDFSLIEHDYNT